MKILRALCLLAVSFVALAALLGADVGQGSLETATLTRWDLRSLHGDELYANLCAACHGLSGQGDGPAAALLDAVPADLTRLTAENGGEFPSFVVNSEIAGQHRGSARELKAMPCWAEVISRTAHDRGQLRLSLYSLTRHVESLQEPPPRVAKTE